MFMEKKREAELARDSRGNARKKEDRNTKFRSRNTTGSRAYARGWRDSGLLFVDRVFQSRHLFDEFFQFNAGERFEDGRQLTEDRRDVACQLARAAAGTRAAVDDDHLFGLRERGGNLAGDLRQR